MFKRLASQDEGLALLLGASQPNRSGCHKEFTSSQGTERSIQATGWWHLGHDVQRRGCGDPALAAGNKGLYGAVDVDGVALKLSTKGPASRVGGNCWSRGRKSGCFSIRCGGESAVSGAPPIRCKYFLGAGAFAYPSSCSLPLKAIPSRSENGATALRDQQ